MNYSSSKWNNAYSVNLYERYALVGILSFKPFSPDVQMKVKLAAIDIEFN